MNDVQPADVEDEGARPRADRAVHRVFGPRELALQRRDPGRPPAQPHAHPAEPVLTVQEPGRGPGRQEAGVRDVELVHQDERGIPDRCDFECRIAGDRVPAGLQVQPGELIGDPPAHTDAEQPGQARRQRNLVGGVQARQLARQDRHPVLPEVLTVEAAGEGVVCKGLVHPAVHHRVGGQAEPGAGGQHHRQMLDLPEGGKDRAGDIDEHVAGVDRGQVARVGRVRAPRPRQRSQRHRAQQPAHQRHDQGPAMGAEPGRTPEVKGGVHAAEPARIGPDMAIILRLPRAPRPPGCTTTAGKPALPPVTACCGTAGPCARLRRPSAIQRRYP